SLFVGRRAGFPDDDLRAVDRVALLRDDRDDRPGPGRAASRQHQHASGRARSDETKHPATFRWTNYPDSGDSSETVRSSSTNERPPKYFCPIAKIVAGSTSAGRSGSRANEARRATTCLAPQRESATSTSPFASVTSYRTSSTTSQEPYPRGPTTQTGAKTATRADQSG